MPPVCLVVGEVHTSAHSQTIFCFGHEQRGDEDAIAI